MAIIATGYVWGLIKSENGWQSQLLFETDARITSFGQDEMGELYLVSDAGDVYKLAPKIIWSSLIHNRRIVISKHDACHWQAFFICSTMSLHTGGVEWLRKSGKSEDSLL